MRDIDDAIVAEAIALIDRVSAEDDVGRTTDLRALVRAREILCRDEPRADPLDIPAILRRSA